MEGEGGPLRYQGAMQPLSRAAMDPLSTLRGPRPSHRTSTLAAESAIATDFGSTYLPSHRLPYTLPSTTQPPIHPYRIPADPSTQSPVPLPSHAPRSAPDTASYLYPTHDASEQMNITWREYSGYVAGHPFRSRSPSSSPRTHTGAPTAGNHSVPGVPVPASLIETPAQQLLAPDDLPEPDSFISGILLEAYHCLFLRLPAFYFVRVTRVFGEVQLTAEDLKGAVVQHLVRRKADGRKAARTQYFVSPRDTQEISELTSLWENFIDSLMEEWKVINIVAVMLLTAIISTLQIQAVFADPVVRTMLLVALICDIWSVTYGCLYTIRFSGMRAVHRAVQWAEKGAAEKRPPIFWNVWVLLAMPAIWLAWSLILFIIVWMTFAWRIDVNGNGVTDVSVHGHARARIAITVFLLAGLVYLVLILYDLREYGERMDKKWTEAITSLEQARLPPGPIQEPPLVFTNAIHSSPNQATSALPLPSLPEFPETSRRPAKRGPPTRPPSQALSPTISSQADRIGISVESPVGSPDSVYTEDMTVVDRLGDRGRLYSSHSGNRHGGSPTYVSGLGTRPTTANVAETPAESFSQTSASRPIYAPSHAAMLGGESGPPSISERYLASPIPECNNHLRDSHSAVSLPKLGDKPPSIPSLVRMFQYDSSSDTAGSLVIDMTDLRKSPYHAANGIFETLHAAELDQPVTTPPLQWMRLLHELYPRSWLPITVVATSDKGVTVYDLVDQIWKEMDTLVTPSEMDALSQENRKEVVNACKDRIGNASSTAETTLMERRIDFLKGRVIFEGLVLGDGGWEIKTKRPLSEVANDRHFVNVPANKPPPRVSLDTLGVSASDENARVRMKLLREFINENEAERLGSDGAISARPSSHSMLQGQSRRNTE